MSIEIVVDVVGEERVLALLDQFADFPRGELLDGLGGLLETQHRRRIESEHTTPAGRPFAPVQRGGTPLYETGRHIRDAFAYSVEGDSVTLTNSFIGAGVHHFGAVITPKEKDALSFTIGGQRVFAHRVIIPARPFMGISVDNQIEILDAVEDFIGGLLQ